MARISTDDIQKLANETGLSAEKRILSHLLLLAIALCYALILNKTLPEKTEKDTSQ